MSRYATTVHNRLERLRRRIVDTFGAIRSFRESSDRLCEGLAEIRTSDDWRRLPRTEQRYLDGIAWAMHEALWREVRFYYVTERGPVTTARDAVPGALKLSDEECRNVDARRYPRGFAWPPLPGERAKGLPLRWFTGPNDGTAPRDSI